MSTKLYVGNLSFKATESDVAKAFSFFGTVLEASVIKDRVTDRPKGFAFVKMEQDTAAQAAILGLHESEFMGRPLQVSLARSEGPYGVGKRAETKRS